jgi:hypothetical protein
VVWFGGEDSCIFQFFLASAGTRLNGPADKQVLKTGSAHRLGILEYLVNTAATTKNIKRKKFFMTFYVFLYRPECW